MMRSRQQWLWYFFVIIAVGTVSSFTFVGKFNPQNETQPKADAIQLLWPEENCDPRDQPCAAHSRDKAIVVRLYPLKQGYRLLLRVHGVEEDQSVRAQAAWLDQGTRPIGDGVWLGPARQQGLIGDLSAHPEARFLRLSLQDGEQLLVADLPL